MVRSGIKQVQVVLPDSSHVWLNRNSELRYANRFQSSTRVVDLKGEAFFQVRHNARQPFVVRTGRATTWVVGTSFNLRADSTAATVELSVVTGKVAFSIQSEKPLLVTPGHAARLDQRGIITTQRVAGSNAWAWQSGRLQFAGNPLHQVLAALERCYNVHFILPDARLANRRFTGTFNHASLEEVLHVLDATLNLHHVQLTETTVSMQEGPRQLTK